MRAFIKRALPKPAVDRIRGYRLAQGAARLRDRCAMLQQPESILDAVWADGHFIPAQLRGEAAALMRVVCEQRPRIVVEIGSQGGGNLFLLSKAARSDARIASLDIIFTSVEARGYRSLVAAGQHLTCFAADSHAAATRERLEHWLDESAAALDVEPRIEVLFIDGDHSYDGVKQDFEMYSPLVGDGGLIALHDIVADYTTRYGRKTDAYTGGVPAFWTELKRRYPQQHREIVDNREQDGCGIGILTWRKPAR